MDKWQKVRNWCGGRGSKCEARAREWSEAQKDAVMGSVQWSVGSVLVSKGVRDPIIVESMCSECSGCVAAVSALKECAENVRWGGAVGAKVGGSMLAE